MGARWSKLALEAHCRGALDFRGASRYERNWLLAERLVLDTIEDELASKLNGMVHQWHCAASASTAWDESGADFEFHHKEAEKAYKDVGRLTLPWYNWKTEKTLEELWLDFKKQEKDPVFQKWRSAVKKKMSDETKRQIEDAARLKKTVVQQSKRLRICYF